jgi:hypothetical protein
MNGTTSGHDTNKNQWRYRVGLFVFLSVAAFFLWTEHRAHLLGALPYLIFLLSVDALFHAPRARWSRRTP